MLKKLDLKQKFEPDFELEDAIRAGKSLEFDFRKLCAVLAEMERKINEVIEKLNKEGGEK